MRSASGRETGAGRDRAAEELYATLAKEADAVANEGDPLIAEAFASRWIGLIREGSRPDPSDLHRPGGRGEQDAALQMFGTLVVETAAQKADLAALVILRSVAPLFTGLISKRAGREADRITADLKDQAWIADIGRAEPTEAREIGDKFRDGEAIVVEFRYPSGSTHSLGVYVDRNILGIAKDAFVSDPIEEVVAKYMSLPGPEMLEISNLSLADARARIELAFAELGTVWDASASDDLPLLRALIESRMRKLPPGGEAPEIVEVAQDARERLLEEFMSSADAIGALKWAAPDDLRYLAGLLIDYASDYMGGDPMRVCPVTCELFLADWFPANVVGAEDLVSALPRVMKTWASLSNGSRRLDLAMYDEVSQAIDKYSEGLAETVADPANWAIGKGFIKSMKDDGIDITDPSQVEAWNGDYNAELGLDRRPRAAMRGVGAGWCGAVETEPEFDEAGIAEVVLGQATYIARLVNAASIGLFDFEFCEIAYDLVGLLARMRPSPIARGEEENWAGGIIYLLCQINWVFSQVSPLHRKASDVAGVMGVNQSTIANKAATIRELLNVDDFDPTYMHSSMAEVISPY